MLVKKGFRKGFTLVEMMIVVAIIAILAGVAIPEYTKYVRKSEAVEAIGFLKQLIDAESTYKSSHGSFYAETDINNTMRVLNVDAPGGKFNYSIQTNANAVLIRAYKNTDASGNPITTPTAPFIYMFFPESQRTDNSLKYDANTWENTVYNLDFINNDGKDLGASLTGGNWVN